MCICMYVYVYYMYACVCVCMHCIYNSEGLASVSSSRDGVRDVIYVCRPMYICMCICIYNIVNICTIDYVVKLKTVNYS